MATDSTSAIHKIVMVSNIFLDFGFSPIISIDLLESIPSAIPTHKPASHTLAATHNQAKVICIF
ncbi:MAG: hypothetical protein ACPHY8_00200 [Patescibacteria group bacterium]